MRSTCSLHSQPHTSGRDMRISIFAPRYPLHSVILLQNPPQNPTPLQTSLPGLSTWIIMNQMALCIPQCYRMTTRTVEFFSHHLLSQNTFGCQDTVHQCCFLRSKLEFRGDEQRTVKSTLHIWRMELVMTNRLSYHQVQTQTKWQTLFIPSMPKTV